MSAWDRRLLPGQIDQSVVGYKLQETDYLIEALDWMSAALAAPSVQPGFRSIHLKLGYSRVQ